MTTTQTQAWAALHNLVEQARKADELHNDLRYAARHASINTVLDGMREGLRELPLKQDEHTGR